MKAIVQEGEPVLRKTAKVVGDEFFGSEKLARLLKDMEEALDKEEDGVALAAPQIGESLRIFIVRKDRTIAPPKEGAWPAEVEVYINPEIIKRSRKKQQADEGCLSVRGMYGKTKRHERATIRAHRPDGSRFERGAGGLLAQIFEHEVDHLNGILFIDHATHLIELKKVATDSDDTN